MAACSPYLAGCDIGAAAEQPVDSPPIHITEVLAATSTAADGTLVFEPVAADGSTLVLTTTPIKIRFDRLLATGTATRQAICLQPVLGPVTTLVDCTQGVYLEPAYDPVRREVVYRQSPDAGRLLGGVRYTLSAYVAVDALHTGFRAFDGAPLETTFQVQLAVTDDGGHPVPYDTIPKADHYCHGSAAGGRSVHQILGGNGCGLSPCHGGADPVMGLDMGSGAGLLLTARGKSAHETQTGEHAATAEIAPARFSRAMPILDPDVPGNSYLVYKLLANPKTPLQVPFADDGAEIARVQRGIIAGMPMPPSNAVSGALQPGDAEWLSEWIQQGAPIQAKCP